MPQPKVVLAQYAYVDVVSFSQRTVEDQAYIVGALNEIVRETLAGPVGGYTIPKQRLILLPTGDGICIVMVGITSRPDLHVKVALGILGRIEEHNQRVDREERRFLIRIGINSNFDNAVDDVNGRRNVAGAGINTAQRIMSMADGGQILLGGRDVSALSQRDGYVTAFREYLATVKHGIKIPVYQLILSRPGLNTEEPSQLSRFRSDQAFSAHLIDVDYLRQLPPDVLQEAELAIRRAVFPQPASPQVESFLNTMHLLGRTPTVWRNDYKVHLSVERDPDDPSKYRSEATFNWFFMNHTTADVEVAQTLYTTPALPIAGKSPEEILELHKVDTDLSRLSRFQAEMVDGGTASQFSFVISVPPSGDPEGFPFEYSSGYILDLGQPWFVVVYTPVCNVTLSLEHPRDLDPELYVFGLRTNSEEATPLKPRKKRPTFREWVYQGWLLAQHGTCLVLSTRDDAPPSA